MITAAGKTQNHAAHCRLCRAPIPVKRRRGSPVVYCSSQHKDTHWKALRDYGPALFAAGRLVIELPMACSTTFERASRP